MNVLNFQEVIFWRNSVENKIEDLEEKVEEETRDGRVEKNENKILELKELLSRVEAASKARGLKDPDEDKEVQASSKESSQEVDFASFNAPCGRDSKRRYAMNGTFSNFQYAQKNAARFEAYDEMESRARKLYDEISLDNYESLSKHVRCLD